jgi:hypothetical protein
MKYPSTPEGLAVSPYELGFTIPAEEDYQIKGGVEMHHRYHSSRWYDPESDGYGAWRQVFRNMEINIDPMLTNEHNKGFQGSLHDRFTPPRMPKDALMIEVVEAELENSGVVLLHNFRRCMPSRIVTPSQWNGIKRRYRSGTH